VRCWPGCFTGSAAVEASGGVVAHERRLRVAVLAVQAAERERFLPLPLSSGFFVFSFSVSFTRGYPFVLSVLF